MNLEEDIQRVSDAVESHAEATGYFTTVNMHEPKSPPTSELTCAIWVQTLRPIQARSGLNRTSGLLVYNIRLYMNMLSENPDIIDPKMIQATVRLMAAYSEDFTLGGLISNVDLLGAHGFALDMEAGYLTVQQQLSRVYTITLPCVINDLFTQAP